MASASVHTTPHPQRLHEAARAAAAAFYQTSRAPLCETKTFVLIENVYIFISVEAGVPSAAGASPLAVHAPIMPNLPLCLSS